MTPILAKWIFTFAATLTPGTDAQWPAMQAERIDGVQEITMVTMLSVLPIPCPGDFGPAPACLPTLPSALPVRVRYFCVPPGVYSLVARVGLAPTEPGAEDFRGALWLKGGGTGPDDGALLVAEMAGKADAWTTHGAAHVLIASAPGMACYQLLYSGTGRATVNPDRRVSYLAIVKLAD